MVPHISYSEWTARLSSFGPAALCIFAFPSILFGTKLVSFAIFKAMFPHELISRPLSYFIFADEI